MKDVHRSAAIGFDRAADVYERARPGYPDAAVDWLIDHLHADGLVVDLAAGTGKMTRALVARGLDVVAVEPVERMRRRLSEALPGARALDGTAEAMPFEDGDAAAVVVAQAFHWFRHAEALEEIHAWQPPFDESDLIRPAGVFKATYAQPMTAESFLDRFNSCSFIAILDDASKAEVIGKLRDLVERHPDLAGKGDFVQPYVTEVYLYEAV
ncbi:MAG: class I SAM-dependent methyltransferase [Actinobacteria bacterium]|nr:MAG: class I SAM-dependent methyltransferase [Actinomycetota bacterium]